MSDIFCLVSMADPRCTLKDCESAFLSGVRFASHNLKLRHNIDLDFCRFTEIGDAILILRNVEDPDHFNCGRHLRGISRYMLKTTQFDFQQLLVGKRLLNYRKISKEE